MPHVCLTRGARFSARVQLVITRRRTGAVRSFFAQRTTCFPAVSQQALTGTGAQPCFPTACAGSPSTHSAAAAAGHLRVRGPWRRN